MCLRFLVVAAVVCTGFLLTIPQTPAPAGAQQTAAQIDFDDLRAQASAALEALQQSHERRVALSTSCFLISPSDLNPAGTPLRRSPGH